MKYLIACLGNIGAEYENTRHNSGFRIADRLAKDLEATFTTGRLAQTSEMKYRGRTLIVIKPTTYMNLSGKAVKYWLDQEKIPIENLLVVNDDIALPLGTIRLRKKGADGGHNGLTDIIEKLGTNVFCRLRFGIGDDFPQGRQIDFVLGQWKSSEEPIVDETVDKAVEAIKSFVTQGPDRTMNQFNKKSEELGVRSEERDVAPQGQNSLSPGQRLGALGWLLIVTALLILNSCSTKVDIYADYKDTAIVYGLIDAKADTNYVKITRAFCGTNDNPINAFEAALVSDSSNYPGKLDVFIEELKSNANQSYQPTGRRFYLDTITIHDKEEGFFYSPHQKVYYTTERFNTNNAGGKYRYQLHVVKPDGDIVTAETSVVDGDISVSSPNVNFQSAPSNHTSGLVFSSTEEAVLYEFGMQFNYREVHPGQPMEKKEISWGYGPKTLVEYEKVVGADNIYRFYYSVNTLFNLMDRAIGNDTVWDENHPNVTRYIDDFYIIIAAAGEEFNNYYQYTQAMQNGLGFSTDYSMINGGYGLFSSRIFIKKKVNLSSTTKLDLFRKPWGFQEQ